MSAVILSMDNYRVERDTRRDTETEISDRVGERLASLARGIVHQAIQRAISWQHQTRCSASAAVAHGVRWAKSCSGGGSVA